MSIERAALIGNAASTTAAAAGVEESRRASERLGWPLVERDERGVWRPWFKSDAERRRYESRGTRPAPTHSDWAAEAAARERRLNALAADRGGTRHATRPRRPETTEERERYLAGLKAADLYPQLRDGGHTASHAARLALAVAMLGKPQSPEDSRAFAHTLGRVGL